MVVHAFFCYCLWLLCGVSGVQTDETETISVTNGDSVTLNTGVTKIKTDIQWTFKCNNRETRIAEIHTNIISVFDNQENNERFKDRLKLDEQTGSLTITNINKQHSGLYKLQIVNGNVRYKTFSISVYGILTVPVIISNPNSPSSGPSNQNCSLLCSVFNVSAASLSWYKANSLLFSNVSDLGISLSLPLEVEYQDNNTYSCVVNNTISNKTAHLNISQHCQPTSESSQSPFLLVWLLPLLILATLVVVMIVYRHRNYTKVNQKAQSEEEVDYTDATFIKHTVEEGTAGKQDQTVYSEVFVKC